MREPREQIDKRTPGEIFRTIQANLRRGEEGHPFDSSMVLPDVLLLSKNHRRTLESDPIFPKFFESLPKIPQINTALSEPNSDFSPENIATLRRLLNFQPQTQDPILNPEPLEPTPPSQITPRRHSRRNILRTAGTVLGTVAAAAAIGKVPLLYYLSSSAASPRPVETPPPSPQAKAPEAEAEPKEINLVAEVAKILAEQTPSRRKHLQENDPEYLKRVDAEVNQHRVNILLNGYGEEHDYKYEDYSGSISIFSIDLRTNQIASISLSRDILTPELSRISDTSGKNQPTALREVFKIGMNQNGQSNKDNGFDLMRKVVENMTGLSVDYQFLIKDTAIRDFIRDVTGNLIVPVDKDHTTNTYRLARVDHPKGFIQQGVQEMGFDKAMQFILAEDYQPQGKQDERSYRKNILFEAMLKAAQNKFRESRAQLVGKLAQFLGWQKLSGTIESDSDKELLTPLLSLIANLAPQLNNSNTKIDFPESILDKNKAFSVHDPSFGDGSVRRVHNISQESGNPSVPDNKDVFENSKKGFYPPWMLIPDGGDPSAEDLINNYWKPIRNLTRTKLGFPQKAA